MESHENEDTEATKSVQASERRSEIKENMEFKIPQITSVQPPNLEPNTTQKEMELRKAKQSPVELLKEVPLPYQEPVWSGVCTGEYSLEVIKNGVPLTTMKLDKPFIVFGRLPQCDITMEHPSLSRYHAILQYCSTPTEQYTTGWYLFDLGSTHGTTINKKKITPKTYERVRVGFCLKFGGSTRIYILQGPEEDQDREISIEEIKEKQREKAVELARRAAEKAQTVESADSIDTGCSWGMDDEPEEEIDPEAPNPFASAVVEELHLDDPKKTLRGWFEREGYDQPEYIVDELTHGRFRCHVELPLDSLTGQPVIAEVTVQGKKKEAVVQCAMEACRTLDKHGVLRQAKHESRKRKTRNWADNDYYGSDDDEFLDRTGDIEKKRKARMKRLADKTEEQQKSLTYKQLTEQLATVDKEISEINYKLHKSKENEVKKNDDIDDLDAYMLSIKSGSLTATQKTSYKRKLIELNKERLRIHKLIKIAQPSAVLPAITSYTPTESEITTNAESKAQPELRNIRSTETDLTTECSRKCDVTGENTTHQSEHQSSALITSSHCETLTTMSDLTSGINEPSIREIITPKFESQERTISNPEEPNEENLKQDNEEKLALQKGNNKSEIELTRPTKSELEQPVKKKKKKSKLSAPSSLSHAITDLKQEKLDKEMLDNPDYQNWLPPQGQSGDGRTSLNDKLGY